MVDFRPEGVQKGYKRSLIIYSALFVLSLLFFYLTHYRPETVPGENLVFLRKLNDWALISLGVLIGANLLDQIIVRRLTHASAKHNLRRVLKLLTIVLVALLFISIVFTNLYAAAVSLGVFSVILGFALQSPTTSFIAWIFILFRGPYRVGDRIQIGEVTGDVLDISYLDTTLWEFGGAYLSTDHPSGRVIKFPNSMVLTSIVYNYSWDDFPYIWNEVVFKVAYTSDLAFVEQTCIQITSDFLGEQMIERVQQYKALLSASAIDNLTVNERPSVVFRSGKDAWIDVNLRYLVYPREQGRVRSRIVQLLLEELNKHPNRVQFPSGTHR